MPQLGETVTEGTILRWAKKVGDAIAEDEVLVEISTDKVDTEVPSPASGTVLQILVDEGDTVSVGTPLVVIGDAGEEPAQVPEPAAETPPAPAPAETQTPGPSVDTQPAQDAPAVAEAPAQVESAGRRTETGAASPESGPAAVEEKDPEVEAFFAEPDETVRKPHLLSPVVRKLIRENEVDVSQLSGTGEGGRITRKDVETYLRSGVPAPAPVVQVPAAAEPAVVVPEQLPPVPAPTPEPVAQPAVPEAAPATTTAPPGDVVELTRVRLRTAENMIKAKQTAAHVWTSVEVDFEPVERVRQAHKEAFKAAEGFSLTYLPFISRAVVDALREFPVVNSSFDLEGKKATFHKKLDLGIAVDLNQGGLVVARIRNADGLRLVGIARQIRDLAEGARNGTLGVDDLTGSTFTITNPGPFGSFMSAPIINVPNVAILSTDTVTKRATVITTPDGQDMIAIRHIGYLGLTWDHRAFDGSTAVMFLQRIKQNLETWDWEQELA
jgi:2-oxoglutarate dehydrogenase E2 component (dihydrolipoamide succinyltransferase)